MSDGIVILGTVSIVGLVAVLAIALVYDRPFLLRRNRNSLEVQTDRSGDSGTILTERIEYEQKK